MPRGKFELLPGAVNGRSLLPSVYIPPGTRHNGAVAMQQYDVAFKLILQLPQVNPTSLAQPERPEPHSHRP